MKCENFKMVSARILTKLICIVLFQPVFIGVLLAASGGPPDTTLLTDAEIAWLEAHPIIRMAPDPEFQPIEFFDENGKYSGIGADYVSLITKKLGIRFEIVRCASWDDVIARVKQHEVDVLNAVVKTPQREVYLQFPPPYLKIPSIIVARKNVVAQDLTLDMLKGMNVAMVSGYGYVDLIHNQYPEIKIELVSDLKAALRKVSFGMVDAFVGDLATASFYIEAEGISNLKLAGETEPANISGFAVRSDWPELSRILEKGVALLTDAERKSIHNKWIHLGTEPFITMQDFRNLMLMIAAIVLVVIFGFLFWNRMLKRKVYLRTQDLRKEIDDRRQAEKALRESDEKHRILLEEANDPIFSLTVEGRYVFANSAFCNGIGKKVEDIIGETIWDVFTKQEAATRFAELNEVFRTGVGKTIEVDVPMAGKDTYYLMTITPIKDHDGQVLSIIGSAKDITKIKKAEEEKIQAQRHAAEQEKNALVGQIAGKISHDFNNILGVIMGNTELALINCTDNDIKKTLKLIFNQTIRGRNLTKNLVAFAKDQEPKQEFFKINEKIDLVIMLLKKDLEGIELMRQDQYGVPDLLADPGMIEHALVNLIQNAIHSVSKVLSPRVCIRTNCSNENICIELEDNGCGIPEKYIERIYEPAFTLKGSRDISGSYQSGIKGTGYGMANVKKYIEQHKGTILVESEVGSGTKFVICLPVIKKSLTRKEKIELRQQPLCFEKYILLVEDEPAISDVQYQVLTQDPCNHKVDIADNGQGAMDLFDRNDYDLISLDYILPGKTNGMDVYHYIRETDKIIPILFISGNIEFLESIKTLQQQDVHIAHLSKPCLNKDYVNGINRLMEQTFN